MHCPVCPSYDTKVIDSRAAEEGSAIRRRRQCPLCGYRFTTRERLEEVPLMVVKRSGGRVPFSRAKVIAGVSAATYLRFASVYKNFDQAADFRRELALLEKHFAKSV